VAELADALDLGSSASGVGVQVPPPAPGASFERSWWNWQTRYLEGVVAVWPCEFESRRPHHETGVWLSLAERLVRDEEVAGSNPVTPTIFKN
jgi:hypothetical protein